MFVSVVHYPGPVILYHANTLRLKYSEVLFMFYGDPKNACWYGKRALLYMRVSTDEQARNGYSLGAQREALDEFVQHYHMTVVGIYSDDGVSARQDIRRRKALLQLLEAVKSGAGDYILFIKLDRWFRSVRDYYRVQDVLDAAGVGWKATLEDYDTNTTNGRLNLNIRLSVAQDESDRTSDRIKFVFDQRVKNGGAIYGTHSLPYGLETRDHRVHVIDDQRAIVSGMFDHFEATDSAHSCVDYLSSMGVNLPFNTVRRMLRNSLYCGQYRDNPAYCEPIISAEQFRRVQDRLEQKAANHTRNRKNEYVFSGLLRCPVCGGTLKGRPGKDYKYNRIYLRYVCNACWIEHTCTFKTMIWEKRIEDWLLDHIQPQLDAYIVSCDIRKQKKLDAKVDTGIILRKIDRLQDLYVDDMISADAYKSKYLALQDQLNAAQAASQAQPTPRNLEPLRRLLAGDFREIYATLTPSERHTLWFSVIQSITVRCGSYGNLDFDVIFRP